jgi:heme-degrading monooxygenase HmoA
MVIRFWSARAGEVQSQAYLEHFQKVVLPKLRRTDGYVGATALTRRAGDEVEILLATAWQSLDAVRRFAGEDFEAAVVEEQAAALLTDFDRQVRHFELAATDVSVSSLLRWR